MSAAAVILKGVGAALLISVAARETLIWVTRPADDRADREAQRRHTPFVVLSIAIATVAAFSLSLEIGVVLIGGAYVILRLGKNFFEQRWYGLPGWGASATAIIVLVFATAVMFLLRRVW